MLAVGVEGRALLHVDEVGDVRDRVLVELRPSPLSIITEEVALVVGEDDQVAVDRLPAGERAWIFPKYSEFELMSSV